MASLSDNKNRIIFTDNINKDKVEGKIVKVLKWMEIIDTFLKNSTLLV